MPILPCLFAQGTMGPSLVVVVAEDVELELQLGKRVRGRLLAQEALECLMEAFDFAAGLRVIRGRVLDLDADAFQL